MNLRTELQALLDRYQPQPAGPIARNTADFYLHQYLCACLPQWDASVGAGYNSTPTAEQTPMRDQREVREENLRRIELETGTPRSE